MPGAAPRRRTLPFVAILVASVILSQSLPTATRADDHGTISGTVTDDQGRPVRADVQAYVLGVDSDGEPAWGPTQSVTTSDASGEYTLRDLGAGTYTVHVEPATPGPFTERWWGGRARSADADSFLLGAGAHAGGVDVALVVGASFAGTIADSFAAAPGARVGAYRQVDFEGRRFWNLVRETTADASGAYLLQGLPGGSYVLNAAIGGGSLAPTVWWPESATPQDAQPLTVDVGEERVGTDFSVPTARATGSVTRSDGTPVVGGTVAAVRVDGVAVGDWPRNQYSTTTDARGRYAVSGLPPGRYTTYARESGGYLGSFWGGASRFEDAATFDVAAGDDHDATDLITRRPAHLSGVVSVCSAAAAPANVRVSLELRAHTPSGDDWVYVQGVNADAAGAYSFSDVPPGKYALVFTHPDCETQWWRAKPNRQSAEAIDVGEGAIVSGLDVRLDPLSSIAGIVTAGGQPVGSAPVAVYSRTDSGASWEMQHDTLTAADGTYRFDGLAPGTYAVKFGATGVLAPEWWGDAAEQSAATPIELGARSHEEIDADLSPGAVISGTVGAIDGGTVAGTTVAAFRQEKSAEGTLQWVFIDSGAVAADGRYRIDALPAGRYTLAFALGRHRLAPEWWGGGSNQKDAETFAVHLGDVLSEKSATLDLAAVVTGTVVSSDHTVRSVRVHAYREPDAGSGPWVQEAAMWSDDTGAYALDRLRPGRYLLQFEGDGLATRWWDGQDTVADATVLVLGPNARRVINAALDVLPPVAADQPTIEGGTAMGEVLTAAAGSGVDGVDRAYQWRADGVPIIGANTSALVLRSRLVGKRITVAVTSSKAGYLPVTRVSTATPPITGGTLISGVPTVEGSAVVGATLSVHRGTWTPGTTFAFQWFADGVALPGETGLQFVLASAHVGARISVELTGSRAGFVAVTKASAETDTVSASPSPTPTSTPTPTPTSTSTPTPAPPPVERQSGASRFDTSAAISSKTFSTGVAVAYIANGTNFPDALSGAPVAGSQHAPVLLVDRDDIPPAIVVELGRLNPGKIVILGGVGAVSTQVERRLARYTTGVVERLAGPDRFATSAAISSGSFPQPGVPVVYIADGMNFPDALSAAPAASITGGPVLLVTATSIPPAIAGELVRLKPDKIVLLGGAGAVSSDVQRRLAAYASTQVVQRLEGGTRYGTSASISAAIFAPGVDIAYVANGLGFPDALSGAAAAGTGRGPVLLVSQDSLPVEIAAELRRLKPKRIVVLGGAGVVSERLEKQLAGYVAPN